MLQGLSGTGWLGGASRIADVHRPRSPQASDEPRGAGGASAASNWQGLSLLPSARPLKAINRSP